jgi:hypothetical protein
MTLVWRPGFQFDADASTYIEAVEAADTQALETGVRYAINDFVLGCKNDGIWDAIKACCILAGARTLSGALVPLVGAAPTNNNFVSGDYNRETGLQGDGSTKYLDSNRSNTADPEDDNHLSAWSAVEGGDGNLIGVDSNHIQLEPGLSVLYARSRSSTPDSLSGSSWTGLAGISRNNSSVFNFRTNQTTATFSRGSTSYTAGNVFVFRRNSTGVYSDARLAFYSIGESLDLAALDTRVSNLITAIGAAIP